MCAGRKSHTILSKINFRIEIFVDSIYDFRHGESTNEIGYMKHEIEGK